MLQRARIRPTSAFRLTARPLPRASHPSFRTHQHRTYYYDPNAGRTPMRSRLRDYAIGAALTVGGYYGWNIYRLWGLRAKLESELKEKIVELKAEAQAMQSAFAEARRSGDHEKLRELTFNIWRMDETSDDGSGQPGKEVGPLPGLPFDDEMAGKELVPAEDTLMFVRKDDEGRIAELSVAVNVEFDELYRGMADPPVELHKDKLRELLRRIDDVVKLWQRQGRLIEERTNSQGSAIEGVVILTVTLVLRDKAWIFDYGDGHFHSIQSGSVGLDADADDEDLVGFILHEAMALESRKDRKSGR
ncbi:hypothetical protein BJ170DRAFT_610251 [Xylariales sp. AK1849]|nr:hypothetical protein BJ170DRAFT_610251 [Xylariales sp. AK1849]